MGGYESCPAQPGSVFVTLKMIGREYGCKQPDEHERSLVNVVPLILTSNIKGHECLNGRIFSCSFIKKMGCSFSFIFVHQHTKRT